jgi:hypothetical protein
MNIIQLIDNVVIIVDDEQFQLAKRRFVNFFHFSRFLTVIDLRGHKITIRKRDIILFEEINHEKEEETN